MPKIVSYKIKATLTRENASEVTLNLIEDSKEVYGQGVDVSPSELSSITSIAAKLADENNKQMEIAKKSLFPEEQSSEATLTLKFLEG